MGLGFVPGLYRSAESQRRPHFRVNRRAPPGEGGVIKRFKLGGGTADDGPGTPHEHRRRPHGEGPIGPRYTLDDLLEYVVAQDASDLHITGGSPPVVLSTR